MVGLATFFITHLFYIFAFRTVIRKSVPLVAAIPHLLYGMFIVDWISRPQWTVGEVVLSIAIAAYIVVFLVMGRVAIHTRLSLVIIGALLFILSDSFLAIDRFVIELPIRETLVMITYYAAQVFFAASIGNSYAAKICYLKIVKVFIVKKLRVYVPFLKSSNQKGTQQYFVRYLFVSYSNMADYF